MKINLLLIFILLTSCSTQKSNQELLVDNRDGHSYKTIIIGQQTWMAENLNYKTDSGSWVYNDDTVNFQKFGRLYNWETACKVCPEGWHLPSDEEWKILEKEVGLFENEINETHYRGENEGEKLKSKTYWLNKNGLDLYGFDAIPTGRFLLKEYAPNENTSGIKYTNGFYDFGELAIFWTSSNSNNYPNHAWFRWLSKDKNSILRYDSNTPNGFAVRCVKNKK